MSSLSYSPRSRTQHTTTRFLFCRLPPEAVCSTGRRDAAPTGPGLHPAAGCAAFWAQMPLWSAVIPRRCRRSAPSPRLPRLPGPRRGSSPQGCRRLRLHLDRLLRLRCGYLRWPNRLHRGPNPIRFPPSSSLSHPGGGGTSSPHRLRQSQRDPKLWPISTPAAAGSSYSRSTWGSTSTSPSSSSVAPRLVVVLDGSRSVPARPKLRPVPKLRQPQATPGQAAEGRREPVSAFLCEEGPKQDGRTSYPEFELMMKCGSYWRNGSRRY
ncbi:hypothetical protein C2845_PM01G45040 [Panicum miliaceum]|uniref:Uncharacterized protein n=1 Tax=Panicum miliaceum TaxID=4540 RepID=A0A3L6TRY4_PANMI|nr:hypothetical protein C2845_PM01G45040 [Panicum miliaceum]